MAVALILQRSRITLATALAASSHFLRHRTRLILLGLVFRGLWTLLVINEVRKPETPGHLSIETGDTVGYLQPIESVLSGGSYTPDYRMPGVGAPYWLLRQVFDIGTSRDIMVILQWLLAGLCVYLLGAIAHRISGSDKVAYSVYFLFLISAYANWYDASISSDSFSVSTLIISGFFLQRALDRKRHSDLIIAGMALAWLIFLRPVSIALLPVMLFLAFRYATWPRPFLAAACIAAPFIVPDIAWTWRNWRANGTFSPLTNQGLLPSDFVDEVRGHAMAFIQCYGGNYIWWAPGSDMRWYGIWKGGPDLDDEGRLANPPPDHAIVEGYTLDSLIILSERVRGLSSPGLSAGDSLAATARINATFDRYAMIYQREAPFNYHVLSRLRMLKNVIWQHGTEGIILRPFQTLPWWLKAFKVIQSMLYIFTYTVGSIAVIVAAWNWRKARTSLEIWLPFVVVFMTLVYSVGLRMCEWRYMVHQFPFALTIAVIFTWRLIDRFRAKQVQTA